MKKNFKDFTLIELLVVISVIAILASLLLPSLNKARATAKRVGCTNQMKQLGVGFHLYSGDYDGWIMGAPTGYETSGFDTWEEVFVSHIPDFKVKAFACPSDERPFTWASRRSYAMSKGATHCLKPIKLVELRNRQASKWFLAVEFWGLNFGHNASDAVGYNNWGSPGWRVHRQPGMSHTGRIHNYLMLDGHAESLQEDISWNSRNEHWISAVNDY